MWLATPPTSVTMALALSITVTRAGKGRGDTTTAPSSTRARSTGPRTWQTGPDPAPQHTVVPPVRSARSPETSRASVQAAGRMTRRGRACSSRRRPSRSRAHSMSWGAP